MTVSSPKILFAVVIYRIAPLESATVNSLLEHLGNIARLSAHILVLDNSPAPAGDQGRAQGFEYVAFGKNVGLAHAYRYAADRAKEDGAEFIVTLDQDSIVSAAYLNSLRDYAYHHAGQEVVFCPRIMSAGRVVSPYVYDAFGNPHFDGRKGELHAINSFSVYATAVLADSKIIDNYYWLDALDFAIYANLHRKHIPVTEMKVDVAHSLSVLDGGMNSERLANMAHYEAAFLFQYCGLARLANGLLRLLVRVVRVGRASGRFGPIGKAFKAAGAGSLTGMRRRGQITQI